MSNAKFASQNLTAGQLNAVIKKLGGEEGALNFLRGLSEVVIKQHLIDCDADPFVPKGWEIVEHIKDGELRWNPDELELYLTDEQTEGSINGNDLRKKLEGKPILNACVLDYLLANPHLIPEEWKGKHVFFWGTIYRRPDGELYVRYLRWNGVGWEWNYDWLGEEFYDSSPAALYK